MERVQVFKQFTQEDVDYVKRMVQGQKNREVAREI